MRCHLFAYLELPSRSFFSSFMEANKKNQISPVSSPSSQAPPPSSSTSTAAGTSATTLATHSSPPSAAAGFHLYSSSPPPTYYWHLSPPLQPKTSTSSDDRILSSAQEREQQRRLSHSSIEKRRREKINDKIQQLKLLIPECNPCPDRDPIAAPSFHQPLHKLNILQAAIDYIEHLHRVLVDAAENPDVERDAEATALLQSPKVTKVIEHAYKTLKVEKTNS